MRSNCLRGCILKSEKELKREGRGPADMAVKSNLELAVTRWIDNSAVLLSSTHEPPSTTKRYNCKEKKYVNVKYPALVKEYSEHMGGVNLFDMLMALYKVDHKSVKWCRRVFLWALNLATTNSWLLYRRHADQHGVPRKKPPDLLRFTTRISAALTEVNDFPPAISRKSGRPSGKTSQFTGDDRNSIQQRQRLAATNALDAVRFDGVEHFPEHSKPKQRCKLCKSYVCIKCVKCNVHLRVTNKKNGFILYHTMK